MPGRKVLAEVIKRQSTIDNVFDDDDIAPGEIDIEVLDDANDTAGLRCCAIRRHRHEVEFHRQRNWQAMSAINMTAPFRTAMSNGARPA